MDREFLAHYAEGVELERLAGGSSRIEFERTRELLLRFLPSAPARVLDVGGGPGVYAEWLVGLGYKVDLIDAVELHVTQARNRSARSGRRFEATLGDARSIERDESSVDAVLVLGPLYHLPKPDDRALALTEARRVVRPRGVVAVAAISRFASLLDGLTSRFLGDPAFDAIVEQDLRDGRHRNPTGNLDYFTTAYFHRPEELAAELVDAGLACEGVFGVEGPGWLLGERWDEPDDRDRILRVARELESEPSAKGVSAHLLAIGRRPA
ncbi:MAG: class I SAM-dependent methyltransferase [Actinomycetota bacterium]